MFTRPDMGWLWLIPISDTVMSVGAVIPQAVHRRESSATPEESLAHYLESTPTAARLMAAARRVTPARFDADYSYLGTVMAGDRWVTVGDAAGFLDPIFSTGVLLAMQGGLDVAAAIDAGLRDGDLSRRRFAAVRAPRAGPVSSLPALRGRLLQSELPRPVVQPERPLGHLPVRALRPRRATGGRRSRCGSGSACSSRWSRSSACSPIAPRGPRAPQEGGR